VQFFFKKWRQCDHQRIAIDLFNEYSTQVWQTSSVETTIKALFIDDFLEYLPFIPVFRVRLPLRFDRFEWLF
jgi:hypothetical protein